MPKCCPHSVRRQISHRSRAGDAVADIATETGISATLFRWLAQALIGHCQVGWDAAAFGRNKLSPGVVGQRRPRSVT